MSWERLLDVNEAARRRMIAGGLPRDRLEAWMQSTTLAERGRVVGLPATVDGLYLGLSDPGRALREARFGVAYWQDQVATALFEARHAHLCASSLDAWRWLTRAADYHDKLRRELATYVRLRRAYRRIPALWS